ncbi:MAG: vitamin K epoxide reductase family protein [bacterium]|nr:vitamin K epoxide reductase family protein [bacterium]
MKYHRAISFLAVLGIIVSGLSLFHHYSRTAWAFCSFGGAFSCDLVNRSIYAEVFGIPVALMGLLGYGALLGVSLAHSHYDMSRLLLAMSLAALAFSLYLTYIEAFVLAVWCLLCLASLALAIGVTLASIKLYQQSFKN